MARTNQGVFSKIKTAFNELQTDYTQFTQQYFPYGQYNCNMDFFSDFSYSADSIFSKCQEVAMSLGGLFQTTKFESKSIEQEYRNMLSETQTMESDIVNQFFSLYSVISQSGLSDVEERTITKLDIYRRNR